MYRAAGACRGTKSDGAEECKGVTVSQGCIMSERGVIKCERWSVRPSRAWPIYQLVRVGKMPSILALHQNSVSAMTSNDRWRNPTIQEDSSSSGCACHHSYRDGPSQIRFVFSVVPL